MNSQVKYEKLKAAADAARSEAEVIAGRTQPQSLWEEQEEVGKRAAKNKANSLTALDNPGRWSWEGRDLIASAENKAKEDWLEALNSNRRRIYDSGKDAWDLHKNQLEPAYKRFKQLEEIVHRPKVHSDESVAIERPSAVKKLNIIEKRYITKMSQTYGRKGRKQRATRRRK